MAVPGILKKLTDRQDEFDAALLGCFVDPGTRPVREIAQIPVVGPGEASVSLVQLVARRFGIVTIDAGDV